MALSTQIRLHSLSVLQSSIVLCGFLWKDKEKKQKFHKGLDWSGNVSVSIQASLTGLG